MFCFARKLVDPITNAYGMIHTDMFPRLGAFLTPSRETLGFFARAEEQSMSENVALVWDRGILEYNFGADHPLKPVRVELTVELSRAYGLLDHPRLRVLPARQATREELETVHLPDYIDAVERISKTAGDPYASYGYGIGLGDNPAFPDMHHAAAHVAGGSLTGAELIASNTAEHAFHPAGGLHHAMPGNASGFCVYNDPAIAIRALLARGYERIAYVDVDVHHGDGVQSVFYTDPRVLTISLHESGAYLFPGTGFPQEIGAGDGEGTSANVALPPSTSHEEYREAFEQVVPPLVAAFKPQVLVTQLGCDTHVTDPLAHLALDTRTYRYLAHAFHELAHYECDGRWLATGGGGYQIYSVVPRAWTIYAAEQVGVELPEEIPPEWIEIAHDRGAGRLPETLSDPPVMIPDAHRERARAAAQQAVAETLRYLKPFHGDLGR